MALPLRSAAVLLNAGAGTLAGATPAAAAAAVAQALSAVGIEAHVALVDAARLADAARSAAARGVDAVVVGGGDGTLGAAAAGLVEGRTPLGVLPLGSLNHFARDLGIPQDLAAAARTIAAGRTKAVDVGDVNGRVFLNNSSIGLYPEMVAGREEMRRRGRAGKRLATVYASLTALVRFPLLSVTLESDGRSARLQTPFVFVGNNVYELNPLELGRRRALDGGELSLYVVKHETRAGLLRLLLSTLAGRLDRNSAFRSLRLRRLEIHSPRRSLRVARDGEISRLAPPIRYRVRPGALSVLVPAA